MNTTPAESRLDSLDTVCDERRVPRDLLPIGSFASRCRLSVKALRHYGELGLLQPEHVDLGSGYRYYHRRQAPVAIAIALLRSLDVPLAVIREVLASEDAAAMTRILDGERERRAQEIARAETALRSIERLMQAGTVFPYDITLRDEAEQTVLVVEGTTTAELHVVAGTALARDLLERLKSLGRPLVGPLMCLLPPTSDDTVILQMCTAVVDAPRGEHVLTLPPDRWPSHGTSGPTSRWGSPSTRCTPGWRSTASSRPGRFARSTSAIPTASRPRTSRPT